MNIQVALVAISLVVLCTLIFVALRNSSNTPRWILDANKKLNILNKRSQTTDSILMATVIIDADKLLDHTLKQLGYGGESMGERLKNTKTYFDKESYHNIWEAHKIRNKLVHEIDYELSIRDARYHFYHLKRAILQLLK